MYHDYKSVYESSPRQEEVSGMLKAVVYIGGHLPHVPSQAPVQERGKVTAAREEKTLGKSITRVEQESLQCTCEQTMNNHLTVNDPKCWHRCMPVYSLPNLGESTKWCSSTEGYMFVVWYNTSINTGENQLETKHMVPQVYRTDANISTTSMSVQTHHECLEQRYHRRDCRTRRRHKCWSSKFYA